MKKSFDLKSNDSKKNIDKSPQPISNQPEQVESNVIAEKPTPQEESKMLSSTMPDLKKNNSQANLKPKKIINYFNRTAIRIRHKSKSQSRSRSPVNYSVEPTLRRTNGIPVKLTDRLNYLASIFQNEKFIEYYNKAPPHNTSSIDQMTRYITKYTGPKGEIEIYAMIFYYICNQITYDRTGIDNDKDNNYEQKPDNVLRKGVALSEGFNKLFEYMCNKKHLKYKVLHGNCKLIPLKKKGENTNHVWNAIYFKGEWYFCDLTMGSGGIGEKSIREETFFNPFYFLTPPEYLIITHRPNEDEWQMNEKTITEKQYYKRRLIDVGAFYQKVYEYNIKLLSHDFPSITISNNELIIKIHVLHTVVQSELFYSNGKDKITDVKYSYDENNNIFSFEPSFPGNGDYIIRILGRKATSTDLLYGRLLDYHVRVCDSTYSRFNRFQMLRPKHNKRNSIVNTSMPQIRNDFPQARIINDYNKIFPSKTNKKICFDNSGTYIFEPKSSVLKRGNEIKFKVKVKGALVVAVLDGKKWTYLKRKDDMIYEGQTVVQSEIVSICTLKACNVYTEVFRFKTYKDRAQLV